jgi:PAS domain S-box-containing protein
MHPAPAPLRESVRIRRAGEAALRRQNAALLALSRSVVQRDTSLAAALADVTRICAETLRCERVSVLRRQAKGEGLTRVHLYEWKENRHTPGEPALPSETSLDAGPDPASPASPAAALSSLAIEAPILMGGKSLGVLRCEDNDARRTWTSEDCKFAEVVASFASLAMERAERLVAQAAAERSRRFLDSLVDSLPLMVFVKDAETLRFVRFNKAAERLTGLRRADVIGRGDHDFFPKEEADSFVLKDRQVLSMHVPTDIPEERMRSLEQGTRILHTRKIALRDAQGRAEYLVGISEDITDRKRAEEELKKAMEAAEAATRAKTRFLATMSHEIRTPMNAVLGLSELLQDADLEGPSLSYAQGIHGAARGLLRVINDVLDLSRIEAGRMEVVEGAFDPRAVVADAWETLRPLARAKGIEFQWTGAPDIPSGVRGDEGRVRQILINLAGNAIKFTERGRVSLELTARFSPPGGCQLLFQVTDTGVGMDARQLEVLFQPFSQAGTDSSRAQDGAGLGLHIAKQLATLMKGEIRVRSSRGVGSTFELELPCRVADIARPVPLLAPAAAAAAPLRILVAEDNTLNQSVARSMLEGAGHTVRVASDGMAALSAFQESAFDVVLMDWQMPLMDGLEAARRIRSYEAAQGLTRTRMIGLTANAMAGDRERILAAGMDGFVAKPFSKGDLLSMLLPLSEVPNPSNPTGERVISDSVHLDPPRIRELLHLEGTSPGFMAALLNQFEKEAAESIEVLKNSHGPSQDVERAAHSLKSMAQLLGGQALANLAAEAESNARAGNLGAVRRLHPHLTREASALAAEAKRVLEPQDAS